MTDDDLLTVEEAAALLGWHPDTVRRRIAGGALPAVNTGTDLYHRWRIRRADVEDLARKAARQP